MSNDLAARLRMLAQDHHEGRLTLPEYRKLRAPLLDSLELRPSSPVDDDAVTRPRTAAMAATSPAASSAGTAPKASSNRTLALVLAAVGVVAVVGIWWWSSHGLPGGGIATTVTGASRVSASIEEVVRPFIDRNDWSDASVNGLNASLLELGHQPLGAAASEQWFQRFVDEVRRRFKEQQALSTAPLTADNSPLAALAVTVGLDLNAPDAAIHIEPAEPVPPAGPVPAASPPAPAPAAVAHSQVTQPSHPPVPTPTPAHVQAPPAAPAPTAAVPVPVSSPPAAAAGATPTTPVVAAAATSTTTAASASTEPCRADLIGTRRPFCHDMLSAGEAAPELALIPAGVFSMGSTVTATEGPVHSVTLHKPFGISVYEVSQAEFRTYCQRPGHACAPQPWTGDDYPVVNVSLSDAHAYVEWLSATTGQHYRLPTEAEWEYAARAGQTGLYPSGDSLAATDAWFALHGAPTGAARRSQQFNRNAFRLYHMIGNVREWVDDVWSGDFEGAPTDGSARATGQSGMHAVRGGSYVDNSAKLRLSTREPLADSTRDAVTGLRIVRELP